jgi:ParB/Sulfiredoxin domain
MIHSGLVQFHGDLAQLMQPIDSIQPHPRNYNNGDLDAIGESIEVNGMYRPLYVQTSTGYILAGNHTWHACKALGATDVPVLYLDVDDTTAFRIMVADNRVAALAEPDNALLLELLDELAATDTLHGTGYEPHDHEVLKKLAEIPNAYDEFATWPTICVQVPPHVRRAYHHMTEAAVGDRERFELMLRLAGWDGT